MSENPEVEEVGKAMKWIKYLLIFLKCSIIFFKFFTSIKRYKQTYKKWNQFEIWIFSMNIFIIGVLMIFEYWWHNTNLIFIMFATNSIMKIMSSYHLLIKALDALFTKQFKRM
jgi:hypothetical protein